MQASTAETVDCLHLICPGCCSTECIELTGDCCPYTLLQVLPHMTDQTISNILYGLAALRVMPSDNYLRALLAATQQLLPTFSPEAFGMTAYALAILCFDPGGGEGLHPLHSTVQHAAWPCYSVELACNHPKSCMGNAQYGMCVAELQLVLLWLQLSAYMSTVARSGWRRSFLAASLQALPNCSAHNLVSMAMLLRQWHTQQQNIPHTWLEAYLSHSQRRMSQFSAQVSMHIAAQGGIG